MSLEHGDKVDPRFNAMAIMEAFGWTYEQYLDRPLWVDPLYAIKCKAEAKYQEIKNKTDG